ncbi:hypothetical protein [Aeromonas salmonicida]
MKSIEDWKKEYEQDNFCGTEFKTPKGGILTVIGIADKTSSGHKKYACHCSICHQNQVMFPELETSQKGHLVRWSVPCACSKAYRWSDRQYRMRLANPDYEIISNDPIIVATQKIRLRCNHDNHVWEANVHNLLIGQGCSKCAAKLRSESYRNSDPLDNTMKRCSELDIKFNGFVGGDYINQKTKLDLECNCGHKWTPTYTSFVNHEKSCPACAKSGYSPNKAGVFYVVHWHKADHEFLKYGITNIGESRITHQMKSTDYTPTILYFPSFNDGNVAAELERECDKRRNKLYGAKGVVSKEEFRDGYTETMNVDQYDWINDLVFDNTMCRLKPIR